MQSSHNIFKKIGFELIADFISEEDLNHILGEIDDINFTFGAGGIRNAEKKFSAVNRYVHSSSLLSKVSDYLKAEPKFVRAIIFNKTSAANWFVPWHQDKTVAVTNKFNESGWGSWSIKDDTLHVQPPIEVLNAMVTLRIHLDAATVDNGCLSVLPGSHRHGIIAQDNVSDYVNSTTAVECTGGRGSALAMYPHLLHSSKKSIKPSQRRVLHLEFSCHQLPNGIEWA